MLLPIVFTLLFLAASVPLVVGPLRRQAPTAATTIATAPPVEPTDYEAQLLALRDLEFDHELGLIADDDYAGLREQLMVKAASALESGQKQTDEAASARIEAAVRSLRQQPHPEARITRFCPQCGRAVDAGDRFCTSCGAGLT